VEPVGVAALVAGSVFTGASLFVSAVENPARTSIEPRSAVMQFKPSFARAVKMQGSLAVLGSALAIQAFRKTNNNKWLAGGALLLANMPWTFAVIMPTNKKLMDASPAHAGETERELLKTWGQLHAVRTALGIAAVATFAWALTE